MGFGAPNAACCCGCSCGCCGLLLPALPLLPLLLPLEGPDLSTDMTPTLGLALNSLLKFFSRFRSSSL
jgi:hypothetical protein